MSDSMSRARWCSCAAGWGGDDCSVPQLVPVEEEAQDGSEDEDFEALGWRAEVESVMNECARSEEYLASCAYLAAGSLLLLLMATVVVVAAKAVAPRLAHAQEQALVVSATTAL